MAGPWCHTLARRLSEDRLAERKEGPEGVGQESCFERVKFEIPLNSLAAVVRGQLGGRVLELGSEELGNQI